MFVYDKAFRILTEALQVLEVVIQLAMLMGKKGKLLFYVVLYFHEVPYYLELDDVFISDL